MLQGAAPRGGAKSFIFAVLGALLQNEPFLATPCREPCEALLIKLENRENHMLGVKGAFGGFLLEDS